MGRDWHNGSARPLIGEGTEELTICLLSSAYPKPL